MSEMGTKVAAELWGVTQRRVQDFCRNTNDPRITQDKKGSPYHIPVNYLMYGSGGSRMWR